MTDADLPPLMRQYWEVKRAYPGAILFFRVGDFYEMFYQDAEEASRLLSIALTSRDKSRADPVPLCGVPHHAATGYIAKLLQAGGHDSVVPRLGPWTDRAAAKDKGLAGSRSRLGAVASVARQSESPTRWPGPTEAG